MHDLAALIPARGGSKGIYRKNLQELIPGDQDSSLIAISIRHASELGCSKIYVSTDDDRIENVALKYKATVIKRPEILASDVASTESVISHAIPYISEEFIVLLQPTNPVRCIHSIRKQLPDFYSGNYDSGLAVIEIPFVRDESGQLMIDDSRRRRQDMSTKYAELGDFYIFSQEVVKHADRVFGKVMLFKTPATDINGPDDLEWVRKIWNGYGR